MLTYTPSDRQARHPVVVAATEVAEGYNYEAIRRIRDHRQQPHPACLYVQPLEHVSGMLMAYFPAERIAFEADLFDTHEPHAARRSRRCGAC